MFDALAAQVMPKNLLRKMSYRLKDSETNFSYYFAGRMAGLKV